MLRTRSPRQRRKDLPAHGAVAAMRYLGLVPGSQGLQVGVMVQQADSCVEEGVRRRLRERSRGFVPPRAARVLSQEKHEQYPPQIAAVSERIQNSSVDVGVKASVAIATVLHADVRICPA